MSTGSEPGRGNVAFDAERLRHDLRGRAVRGGAATMAAQAAKFVLIFGSTLVLARLLTPEDFGLVGMVHPVVALVWLMRDLGLSTATVQRERLEERQVNALFWINVLASLVLGGLVAAASPLVAAFYGEDRLVWITAVVGATMIVGGLGNQHQAIMRREIRLLELGACEVVALGLGVIAAVSSAVAGLEYWALVINIAVREVSLTALLMLRSGWRPSAPRDLGCARDMLAFGGYIAGSKILDFLTRNVDTILVGRTWGPSALGLYNVAYRLLMLPIQQINGPLGMVAIPVLSRLQAERERFVRFYRRGMLLLASASMPVVMVTAAAAERMVVVLAGEQWRDATPIFLALVPAAWIGSFNMATGWVFVSLGLGRRQLTMKLLTVPVVLAGIAIGVRYGAIGAAIGFSAASVLVRPFAVWYCFAGTPLRVLDLVAAIGRPTTAGAIAAAAAAWTSHAVGGPATSILALVGVVAVFGVTYVAAWIGLPGGVTRFRECAGLVAELRRRPSRDEVVT